MSSGARRAGQLSHFAINADDVTRAKRFYERVFGWRFEAWGPPGFFMIDLGADRDSAPRASLQQRRELIQGERMTGFECTVAVANVDAVMAAILANGGEIVVPKTLIPSVGYLLFFRDPEGNVAGAIQPDAGPDVDA